MPHTIDTPPKYSYATVMDHLKSKIGIALDQGHDIVKAIETDTKLDFMDERPKKQYVERESKPLTRELRQLIKDAKERGETIDKELQLTPEEEELQEFYDLEFNNAMKLFSARKEKFRENWPKAYDYIWSFYMTQEMRDRIEADNSLFYTCNLLLSLLLIG